MDVLVIQNTRIEGTGFLGKLLESDGFNIRTVFAKSEKIPENYHKLLIILGAPESANDQHQYLLDQQNLIRKYVKKEIPVLGICLGSQLIAKSFGAKVYRGEKKEIGFYDDLKKESPSSLFNGFEDPFTVFHWHSDTFDLPPDSKRLVSSWNYQNQAFQLGSAVGLQFHLEVDEDMVNLWLDKTQEKLEKIPYIEPKIIRQDIGNKMNIVNENMKKFYNNFKLEFDL